MSWLVLINARRGHTNFLSFTVAIVDNHVSNSLRDSSTHFFVCGMVPACDAKDCPQAADLCDLIFFSSSVVYVYVSHVHTEI